MSKPYEPEPLPPRDPTMDASQNHYWKYHSLEALLACKKPVTASRDEDLFICVHQICELSFHQMCLDMERTLEAFGKALDVPVCEVIGDSIEITYFLQRVVELYGVVNRTIPVLTTMRGFAEFRQSLGPTSGFQSFQFRHLEIMSGVTEIYWRGGTRDAEGNLHIAETEFERCYGEDIRRWLERHARHNLGFYFRQLWDRALGHPSERLRQLQAHPQAYAVLKMLRNFDEAQLFFHQVHLSLAVQQLRLVGVEIGTGGTSFKEYLTKYRREQAPLFPGLSGLATC